MRNGPINSLNCILGDDEAVTHSFRVTTCDIGTCFHPRLRGDIKSCRVCRPFSVEFKAANGAALQLNSMLHSKAKRRLYEIAQSACGMNRVIVGSRTQGP